MSDGGDGGEGVPYSAERGGASGINRLVGGLQRNLKRRQRTRKKVEAPSSPPTLNHNGGGEPAATTETSIPKKDETAIPQKDETGECGVECEAVNCSSLATTAKCNADLTGGAEIRNVLDEIPSPIMFRLSWCACMVHDFFPDHARGSR